MQEKLYGNLRFFRLSWTLDRTAHAILSHSSKNALKKVLDISESYGIFVNVYFDIKTILFKNNETCYIGPKYKNSFMEVIDYDTSLK